jgi:uncharacterized membrane-anchored protein
MNQILFALCIAIATSTAWAQPNAAAQAEMQAALDAANKAAISGPTEVKLVDQAMLKLPDGLVYIPPAEAGRLLAAMGNRVGDNLLGVVVSPAADANWFVVMRFFKSGYIKDDDAKEWKTDELLSNLKEGTEEGNKERRSRGISEIEVVGWVEAPKYDTAAHRLVWSLESKEKGAPARSDQGAERGVNYNTYALGRDGYISMNLVTALKKIDAERPVAHQLLAALQYNGGKQYGDFNSATDYVAEFGLAALIGGVAAKKLGLFALALAFLAKFAKVIGIAAIALGAVALKFFRRKPPAA